VCAAYLVVSYLIKPQLQPDWVNQAYLIEPVRDGAVALERLLPEPYRENGLAAAGRALDGVAEEGRQQALERLLTPEPER
jgi:hypothetical protein